MVMIANYKGNEYYYSCKIIPFECDWRYYQAVHEDYSSISTYKVEKAEEDFKPNKYGKMAKKIDEEELTDIFYVMCYVDYDTGLSKIPTEWLVNDFIDGKIEIEYGLGLLPGWTGIEQYVCRKQLDKSEVSSPKIGGVYTKKDGVRLSEPFIEEKNVDIDELIRIYMHYLRENI